MTDPRFIEVEMPDTVDELLTVCDLQRWAVERAERPTLAETLEDEFPHRHEDAS